MFFIISKTLGLLVIPSNIFIGIGVIGILLQRTRFGSLGKWMLVTSVILIALVSYFPLGTALQLPLEDRFPRWSSMGGPPPTGIIVLGGTIDPDISATRGEVALNGHAERIIAAVELAHRYPNMRVIFAGGSGSLIYTAKREADYATIVLEKLGISQDRITLDRNSRNTIENAIFAKRLAAPKPGERWLLITSAMHMPRAIGVFRGVGFPVEAYPVDYQTAGPEYFWSLSRWPTSGLSNFDAAAHEWVGLFMYWITGRTSKLFPGPEHITNRAGTN